MAAGDYSEACSKFEASLALDVGIGTKFNLGDCYEHLGRPLAAKKLFLEVAERSHESGQIEREHTAQDRAAGLDAKIPKLVLDVKVGVNHLELKRDGVLVEPNSWGAPVPVEPGQHKIEAAAPGRKSWSSDIDVTVDKSPVTVTVPELQGPEAAAEVKPEKVALPSTEAAQPTSAELAPPSRMQDNTVPIILYSGIGAGLVLAGTSLIFYKASNDNAKTVCPSSTGCSLEDAQHHTDLVRDAETARGLAYLGFGIAGASAIAAGVVALARSPGKEEKAPRASLGVDPLIGRDGIGAQMHGSF